MKENKKIYSLSVGDVQNVSQELIYRKLNDEELSRIIKLIERDIQWHEIISNAIREAI